MEDVVGQANSHFTYMGSVTNTLQEKYNALHTDKETQEHITAVLDASDQQTDQETKRLIDELASQSVELLNASAAYSSVANECNQARKDCFEYKRGGRCLCTAA